MSAPIQNGQELTSEFLVRQFVWVAWHLKGAFSLKEWLEMYPGQRDIIIAELIARIEAHDSSMGTDPDRWVAEFDHKVARQ